MSYVAAPVILPQIEELSQLVADRIGLDFPRRKWDMLQRVVDELSVELNFSDPRPLLEELLNSPLSEDRLNQLIVRLTVGETYFLRDKSVFTVLQDHIFPAMIEQRASERRLDIWCAASSTGEEPYSIAMLLDEKAEQLNDWQINIGASDLNLDVLDKARKGVYSQWSLRATPEDINRKYFTKIGKNQFLLARHIREMVSFYQLNLAEEKFVMPGFSGRAADIIFCRNVLIYFSAELQVQVIKRLVSLLRPGGWLLVAPSELGVVNDPELITVRFPGAIVHQKRDRLQTGPVKVKSLPGNHELLRSDRRSSLRKFTGTDLSKNNKTTCKALNKLLPQAEKLFIQESYREVLDLIFDLVDSSFEDEPEYARIMTLKAQSLANMGELEAAAVAVEMALKVDKVDPFLYYLSATIARERGDYAVAAVFYKQTLFLDADFVMAHFSLATLLRDTDRKAVARHLRNVINQLESLKDDTVLPHAEGLTSGRLLEIARSLLS